LEEVEINLYFGGKIGHVSFASFGVIFLRRMNEAILLM
jgi:hypothetical protein